MSEKENPWVEYQIKKLDLLCALYKKLYRAGYSGLLRDFVDNIVMPLRDDFYRELQQCDLYRFTLDSTILKEDFDPIQYLKEREDKMHKVVELVDNLRRNNPKLYEAIEKMVDKDP